MSGRRYVVISPCRDEQDHFEANLRAMLAQTVRPTRWVIVDDGSSDRTPEMLAAAVAENDWIQVVRREDRGRRKVGSGVIDAFNAGLATVDLDAFDYLCKFDIDIEIPPRYFERVLEEMERNPRLGTFSGKTWLVLPDGRKVLERQGDENSIGPAKFYRVACYREIGGFAPQAGWDGIDGHMCRLKGWAARSTDEPELEVIHRRLMGSSEVGIWHGRKRWGRLKWYMGSAPYYVAAVSLYRMMERPFVVGGLGIAVGYLGSFVRRDEQFGDEAFRKYVRRFERTALLRGKSTAIKRFEPPS